MAWSVTRSSERAGTRGTDMVNQYEPLYEIKRFGPQQSFSQAQIHVYLAIGRIRSLDWVRCVPQADDFGNLFTYGPDGPPWERVSVSFPFPRVNNLK